MSDNSFWVEVFSAGDHTDSQGKRQKFSEQDLDMIVSAFNATRGEVEVPVRLNLGEDPHSEYQAIAVGWVGDVKREGGKLLALFTDVPANVVTAFKKKLLRKVSVGLRFNRELAGRTWARFLDHVAVLGAHLPAVKGLADLDAYIASEAEKLGAVGEGVHVFESTELTLDISDHEEVSPMADDNKALEILSKQVAELTASFTEIKADNEKLKAERDAAIKRAETAESADEKRQAAFTEAERKRVFDVVKADCEARVTAKKMSPAQRDALLKGLDAKADFSEGNELLIPVANVMAFAELSATGPGDEQGGHKGDEQTKASERVLAKANELVAKSKMDFGEAMRTVLRTDAELAAEYAQEVK